MKKRFIVIKCETLGDQWECDADREIQPMLYTEEEVKTLFGEKTYGNPVTGKEYSSIEECKTDTLLNYDNDLDLFLNTWGYETEKEAWEDQCEEIYNCLIEVYEIKGSNLIFREDLSTYKG